MANNKIYKDQENLLRLFKKPTLMGLVGRMSEGKSNMIYWLIQTLREKYHFSLYSFGLHLSMGETKIYSLPELEVIHDSIIFLDEFPLLIRSVEDRTATAELQKTIQQVFHRNNCVVFCGLERNFNKYFSCQLRSVIYKRCAIDSFVNGSDVKKIALRYGGAELGSAMLNVEQDEALVWDGQHYHLIKVPYVESCDTKINNAPILTPINVTQIVIEKAEDVFGKTYAQVVAE